MSRTKESKWSSLASDMKPAAASVKPMADSSAAAVKRSMIRTRAWAAPQVAHAGHFVQDSAAPKFSAMLFSAARRLDPARKRGQRWRKVAGASAVGAAGGLVAITRIRRKKDTK